MLATCYYIILEVKFLCNADPVDLKNLILKMLSLLEATCPAISEQKLVTSNLEILFCEMG